MAMENDGEVKEAGKSRMRRTASAFFLSWLLEGERHNLVENISEGSFLILFHTSFTTLLLQTFLRK